MKIGLVFEGGGGKGAYQIGVWRALRELNIENQIVAISGTSVGALNAALFYQGGLTIAEETWKNISNDDILKIKENDDFDIGDCYFSQTQLAAIISSALKGKRTNTFTQKCFVTCRRVDEPIIEYFEWSRYRDSEYKKRILLASSAIPIVFENVEIDGTLYMDGGVPNSGDNTPITPLLKQMMDLIIVVHLGDGKISEKGIPLIEINPSEDIGKILTGTIDFSLESIRKRMQLGYEDAITNYK